MNINRICFSIESIYCSKKKSTFSIAFFRFKLNQFCGSPILKKYLKENMVEFVALWMAFFPMKKTAKLISLWNQYTLHVCVHILRLMVCFDFGIRCIFVCTFLYFFAKAHSTGFQRRIENVNDTILNVRNAVVREIFFVI